MNSSCLKNLKPGDIIKQSYNSHIFSSFYWGPGGLGDIFGFYEMLEDGSKGEVVVLVKDRIIAIRKLRK